MRSRGPVRMWASASATPQNASPYGLRWSFAPADAHIGTRRKTSTRGLESTFHNKVLIEEADISCINKSGHFHVLPTSAGSSGTGLRKRFCEQSEIRSLRCQTPWSSCVAPHLRRVSRLLRTILICSYYLYSVCATQRGQQ